MVDVDVDRARGQRIHAGRNPPDPVVLARLGMLRLERVHDELAAGPRELPGQLVVHPGEGRVRELHALPQDGRRARWAPAPRRGAERVGDPLEVSPDLLGDAAPVVAGDDRLARRANLPSGAFPVLEDLPQESSQVGERRLDPAVRAAKGKVRPRAIGDVRGAAVHEVGVVVTQEVHLAATPRGDDGPRHQHGLHERPAPSLPSRRQHEGVGGLVERRELVDPEQGGMEDDVGRPGPAESVATQEGLHVLVEALARLARARLRVEDQRHALVARELFDEGPHQDIPALAESPAEDRQEVEAPGAGNVQAPSRPCETLDVDGLGHPNQLLRRHAGVPERLHVERARHPDLVQGLAIGGPLLGHPVRLEHGPPDVIGGALDPPRHRRRRVKHADETVGGRGRPHERLEPRHLGARQRPARIVGRERDDRDRHAEGVEAEDELAGLVGEAGAIEDVPVPADRQTG